MSRIRYPQVARVVDTGEDVVDGRVVETRTTVHAALPVWVHERGAIGVVYGEGGAILEDGDVLSDVELAVGQELELTDGPVWVVVRPSRTRLSPRGPHHYSTPVRRLE